MISLGLFLKLRRLHVSHFECESCLYTLALYVLVFCEWVSVTCAARGVALTEGSRLFEIEFALNVLVCCE